MSLTVQYESPPPSQESEDLIESIQAHQLPETLTPILESYAELVGDRPLFLWKWAHMLFPEFTLSCVPPAEIQALSETKLLALMYVSVLDDLAEKHGDHASFEEARKFPFGYQEPDFDRPAVDTDVLSFVQTLWSQLADRFHQSPRGGEFQDILQFDIAQVQNAIEYSYVVNSNPNIATQAELEIYESHNMMLFVFADIDLLHSPSFDRRDLGALREIITHTQRMARIGNWITTWERELSEGDVTSGIVVYALEQEIIELEDVFAIRENGDDATLDSVISTIHDNGVENVFLDQWAEEYATASQLEPDIASVDTAAYLESFETVMDYHMASKGYK